ncbi:hypothetical protein C8R45DRAFT_1165087 [Mycena sanguinolenta]|nr:hypothetical protein C8R45DRAFT_1165087 [Mycena sanguinolenta]
MAETIGEIVISGLRDVQAVRFFQLASSAIIIFDHMVTLDREYSFLTLLPVEVIDLALQTRRWLMAKSLFIINRYYTLAWMVVNNYGEYRNSSVGRYSRHKALFSSALSNSVCPAYDLDSRLILVLHSSVCPRLLLNVLADYEDTPQKARSDFIFHRMDFSWRHLVTLQMRLYALYSLNKKVLVFMLTVFLLSSGSSAVIMGMSLQGVIGFSHPLPWVTFCVAVGFPDYFFAFWIPILCFESLLCVLALYQGLRTFRIRATLFQSTKHLMVILIRDSVFYFFVIFAAYLFNMLTFDPLAPVSIPPFQSTFPFSDALSCCISNRMILNLLEEMKR